VSLHRGLPAEECNGRTLTCALEWNLQFSLMEYLVDRRGWVRNVFLKSKNRAALVDEVFHAQKTFHIHEYLDHFRAIHLGVSAHVLVLPIFQRTAFSSHDVAILIARNRSFTRTRLSSAIAHKHSLPSGSSGSSTSFPTCLNDISRNHISLQLYTQISFPTKSWRLS